MSSQVSAEVVALGQQFQQLRTVKGHFEGGEFDKDVDGFNGAKHKAMLALEKGLGVQGTPASAVIEVMGKPDRVAPRDQETLHGMPGPSVPAPVVSSGADDAVYLIYNWRGSHDYLRFLVSNDAVVTASWYQALE
ncbi:hypothetical protein HDU97_009779 [Phlyctochytrium planicorne]|nr:hypothetical protein HDU97_009779 [Phlyctochytrium planicorne]